MTKSSFVPIYTDFLYENRIYFDKDSTSPILLKNLQDGSLLYHLQIVVIAIFDNGFKCAVGIPGTEDLFVGQTENDLHQGPNIYDYKFLRESTTAETMNLYLYGTSTAGSGYIYLGTKKDS